jgi:hypothetical protein
LGENPTSAWYFIIVVRYQFLGFSRMVALSKAQAKIALDHVLENLFELDTDAAMINAFTKME